MPLRKRCGAAWRAAVPLHYARFLTDGTVFEIYPARPGRETGAFRLGLAITGAAATPRSPLDATNLQTPTVGPSPSTPPDQESIATQVFGVEVGLSRENPLRASFRCGRSSACRQPGSGSGSSACG